MERSVGGFEARERELGGKVEMEMRVWGRIIGMSFFGAGCASDFLILGLTDVRHLAASIPRRRSPYDKLLYMLYDFLQQTLIGFIGIGDQA